MGDADEIGVAVSRNFTDAVDGSQHRRRFRLPFPDEDHACEPRRRVKFAKLPRNALPPSPVPVKNASVISPNKRSLNSTSIGKANQLSGPTSPSPSTSAAVQSVRRNRLGAKNGKAKLENVAAKYLPRRSAVEQWMAIHSPPRGIRVTDCQVLTPIDQSSFSQEVRAADYDLYLYFASKFGPLDGVLFCCSPLPGRTYRRLANLKTRILQRWLQRRMKALRRFWVVHFACSTTTFAIESGVTMVAISYRLEERAAGFLAHLRRLRAARMVHLWRSYTLKLQEVRGRYAQALEQCLRARFTQWRERIVTMKQFKRKLKTIARRKAMLNAMEQWQQWKLRHAKLRCHLTQRWIKIQQGCWVAWICFIQETHAGRRIQKRWRLALWRWHRALAATTITLATKGYLARKYVYELRVRVEVGRVTMGLVEQLVWTNYHRQLVGERSLVLENEIERSQRERETVDRAVQSEEARVNGELSAVVRNAMHQRLQERMKALKDSPDGGGSSWKLLKNHTLLRQIAAQELMERQRVAAKDAAITAFRIQDERNLPSEVCFVCGIDVDGDHPMSVWWPAAHDCIPCHVAASNPVQGRAILEHLDQKEQLRAQAMVRDGWILLHPHHL